MRTAWVLALALGTGAAAQQEPVIRVDVDVVNLFSSVRDRRGAFLTNLDKDQFRVYEDGKLQEIKYFTQETDLPLTIGLLVDVSGSQQNLLDTEKRAAAAFFRQVLTKKDMAFLISFGSEAELLQDFTNSARLLEEGLEQLRLSVPVRGVTPAPVPTKVRGTILYDAVYLASEEKLKREVGRKVIVLITDGVDMGSRISRAGAIEAAHKSDAIVYSIYYVDPRAYGGMVRPSDSDLKRLAEETGGRVFRVDRNNRLEDIFTEIQREMRSQYAIGYTPSNPVRDGSFRKIEIKMANRDHRVLARKGYYATPE